MDRSAPPEPPTAARRPAPVRWGLPDVALSWLGATIVGAIAYALAAGPDSSADRDVWALLAGVAAQAAATFVLLGAVSARKGRGTLHADFGLAVRIRDAPWFLAGMAFQVAALIVLIPFGLLLDEPEQEVVARLQDARGLSLALFAVSVVVVAPVAEELLFRGALLRALQRRMPVTAAVIACGLIFGVVHFAVFALPGLAAVGVVASILAVRSGSLSSAIFFHAGFNALTTALAILGAS